MHNFIYSNTKYLSIYLLALLSLPHISFKAILEEFVEYLHYLQSQMKYCVDYLFNEDTTIDIM